MNPVVFILDLDGTVIGDVRSQVLLYELKSNNVNITYNFEKSFDEGLIRPYFDSFLKNTKRRLPNAEFFIYTASEDKWANKIVTSIEKHISFRFNRPIFSRKHCTPNGKRLDIILPAIKRSLKKTYGNVDLENRIMVIDNSEVYDKHDSKKLLLCNTYDKMHLENLPAIIREDVFIRNQVLIKDSVQRYYNIDGFTTYKEFERVFYAFYIQESPPCSDSFWLLLLKLLEIKNISKFGVKSIAYINQKLRKRMN
jgi:hypothetical protein